MHATRFAALGDATRFRLVEMLSEKPLPVHVLTSAFSISRPAISRHLRVLKEAGVVIEEKQGRENLYKLQAQHLVPLSQWLSGLDLPVGQASEKGATIAKPAKEKRIARPKAAAAPPTVKELKAETSPVKTPEIQPPETKVPEVAPIEVKASEPARKAKPVAPAPAQNQMAWEF